jgi:hypothetical protein
LTDEVFNNYTSNVHTLNDAQDSVGVTIQSKKQKMDKQKILGQAVRDSATSSLNSRLDDEDDEEEEGNSSQGSRGSRRRLDPMDLTTASDEARSKRNEDMRAIMNERSEQKRVERMEAKQLQLQQAQHDALQQREHETCEREAMQSARQQEQEVALEARRQEQQVALAARKAEVELELSSRALETKSKETIALAQLKANTLQQDNMMKLLMQVVSGKSNADQQSTREK